jgi:hypothetical protein
MKAPLPLLAVSLLLAGCTADVREQYEIAFTKDQKAKQAAWDRADEAECQRQGAQQGSDFYNLCRKRLADKHIAEEEALDRQRMGLVR